MFSEREDEEQIYDTKAYVIEDEDGKTVAYVFKDAVRVAKGYRLRFMTTDESLSKVL